MNASKIFRFAAIDTQLLAIEAQSQAIKNILAEHNVSLTDVSRSAVEEQVAAARVLVQMLRTNLAALSTAKEVERAKMIGEFTAAAQLLKQKSTLQLQLQIAQAKEHYEKSKNQMPSGSKIRSDATNSANFAQACLGAETGQIYALLFQLTSISDLCLEALLGEMNTN